MKRRGLAEVVDSVSDRDPEERLVLINASNESADELLGLPRRRFPFRPAGGANLNAYCVRTHSNTANLPRKHRS